MANLTFTPPTDGAAVTMQNGRLCVPDRPIIPFIIGDGTGPEIWAAASRVIDAAVKKAYQGKRSIAWYEVFAGQKSFDNLGTWLPNETVEAFRTYLVGIKGPLTTPVGGGIRSLNVTLRQDLDLFVCLRPVRYFNGIETPVKAPEKYGGHLRRNRIQGRVRGRQTVFRHHEPHLPGAHEEGTLPGELRLRHQARFP